MASLIETHDRKIHELAPLHGVTDQSLLARLVRSMSRHGWRGQALVLLDGGQLITGSHRWAAAIAAQVTSIPVVDARDIVMRYAPSNIDEYDERLTELCESQTSPEEIRDWLFAILPAAASHKYGIEG